MMPHKNLFSGALGKLQNIGGSRIYTTPHTVSTPAEYSINVTMNIQGDLVSHSLDGRLWLYRRSRRLGIIALKWDTRKAELEYAAGQNISGNDDVVLACGLDWVLTNNNIFMVVDDEPYILTARLFDANIPDNFLYSLLRSGSIGASGIDPFTGEAWGKREDNGNSEGTGYFSKSTHLLYPAGDHAFEQCYSLLPPVGDWQIFENFLIHRPAVEETSDTENITSYNYMQAVRPLIPLEFANGAAAYGTGYNMDHRGIQLFHHKGEIWGRGLYNIGKVYLLPAVFGENGEVLEYYLYISPDYPCSPFLKNALDKTNSWLETAIAFIGSDSLYGFLSEQPDSLSGRACFKSTNGRILSPATGEFLILSEDNARLFFDALSYKGVLLDNNGGQLMLGKGLSEAQDVKCKTLQQWLAPAGYVDAVTNDYIAASADNSAFCTSLVTGLNRQFLSPNTIPLTAKAFQDSNEDYYRLAISDGVNESNRKIFGVNKILAQDVTQEAIKWREIYKEPVKFTFIKVVDSPNNNYYCMSFEYDDTDNSGENNVVVYGGYGIPDHFIYGQEISRHMAHVRTDIQFENQETYYNTYIDTSHSFTSSEGIAYYTQEQAIPYEDPYPELGEVNGYVIRSASAKVIFLNPLNGSLHEVSFSRSFSQTFSTTQQGGVRYHDISRAEVPYGIGYTEKKIGFFGFVYDVDKGHTYGPYDHSTYSNSPYVFFPCADFPDFVLSLRPDKGEEYIEPSISIPVRNSVIGWDGKENPCNVFFQDQSSGVKFIQQSSIHQDTALDGYSLVYPYTFPNYDTNFTDSAGTMRAKQNFHIIEAYSNDQFKLLLFHSEFDPDVFDFPAELERSKSH